MLSCVLAVPWSVCISYLSVPRAADADALAQELASAVMLDRLRGVSSRAPGVSPILDVCTRLISVFFFLLLARLWCSARQWPVPL